MEESLKREVQEETGGKVENLQYFTSGPDTYVYQGIKYHTLGFIYTGKIKYKNLRPGDDVEEMKFFPKDKIPFRRLAFKELKRAVKMFVEKELA